MLFGFGSNQDFADSSQVIAFASAGGLGLPDRDYYTKTDAKSARDAPEVRGARRSTCSNCWASRQPSPKTHAADRDGHRDRAGQGVAHARRKARSLQAVPQDDARPAAGFDAVVSVERLLQDRRGAGHFGRSTSPNRRSSRKCETLLKSRSLDDWKTYLRWHLVHAKAPLSFLAVRGRQFRFLQQVPARRGRDAAALEALRAARGRRSRRSAGPGVRARRPSRPTPSSARSR